MTVHCPPLTGLCNQGEIWLTNVTKVGIFLVGVCKLTRIHSNLDPCCAIFQKAAATQKLAKLNVTPHRVAVSGQRISLKKVSTAFQKLCSSEWKHSYKLPTYTSHHTSTGYGVSIHYTNTIEHKHSNMAWWPWGVKTRRQALKWRKCCTLPILLTFKSKKKKKKQPRNQYPRTWGQAWTNTLVTLKKQHNFKPVIKLLRHLQEQKAFKYCDSFSKNISSYRHLREYYQFTFNELL